MKKGILISCRTASKRLSIRLFYQTKNHQFFYLFENLNNSIYKDNLILCTTNLPSDDVLVDLAKEKINKNISVVVQRTNLKGGMIVVMNLKLIFL